MNTIVKLIIGLLLLSFWSCNSSHEEQHGHETHGHANHFMNKISFEELVSRFEDSARLEWQKPDAVISMLGDISGLKVMDIGCGTGYFAFRLVEAGADVVCSDVDDRFLSYVNDKSKSSQLEGGSLETKKLPYDSPELDPAEVDVVIIVNTYHHIEKREAYFAQVLKGLKENGRLMVVDFVKEEVPEGPPVEMKFSGEEVMAELTTAGFSDFLLDEELLPYQYVLVARK
ncbi:MAG: class I SAM-dependent methyltransferase [Bacteroidia bacterium]|nr:class I SAM-dependent methyltransferase [Bacteroidia bacterium]